MERGVRSQSSQSTFNTTDFRGSVLRSGKLSAEAAGFLELSDSQASAVNDLLTQGLERVNVAEKKQAELVSEENGVFFRLPPAIGDRLMILNGLRDSLEVTVGKDKAQVSEGRSQAEHKKVAFLRDAVL